MKDLYKKVLIGWLILYAILGLFSIINSFNSEFLPRIMSIGVSTLDISLVILFVFVGLRGEEKIAKYGLICTGVSFLFYLLFHFSVFSLILTPESSFFDRICSLIYYVSVTGGVLFQYLAIFSLFKGDEKIKILKLVALVGVGGYVVLTLLGYLFISINSSGFSSLKNIFTFLGNIGKYTAIILFLIDSDYVPKLFTKDDGNHKIQSNVVLEPVSQHEIEAVTVNKDEVDNNMAHSSQHMHNASNIGHSTAPIDTTIHNIQ